MKARLLGLAIGAAVACTPAARTPATRQAIRVSEISTAPIARTPQQTRVIVRRAALEIEVEEVRPALDRATRLAALLEGYAENVRTTEEKAAYLTLRVASTRLVEALDSLASLGKVTDRSLSEQDVTPQSIDLEARVASFRAARDKLRELLDRAATVADAVAAQAELARVQAELDSLEGQLRALESSVALSEISVTLNRRIVLGPLGVVGMALAQLLGKLFVWR
jgi:hypothetical protein